MDLRELVGVFSRILLGVTVVVLLVSVWIGVLLLAQQVIANGGFGWVGRP